MLPVRRPGALNGATPQPLGLGTSQDLSEWGRYRLGTHGRSSTDALSTVDSVGLEWSQIRWDLRTPDLLLVASGVEYAAARIKVRANVDPIRQLRVTGTGSISFAWGGRSAHGLVGDLVPLPGEERGWV